MYLADYADPQLAGIGKKLKKVFKKIAKPLAHIGAAVFTGGSSLAISASMLKARADRKSAESMNRAQIAAAYPEAGPIARAYQTAPIAPSASPVQTVTQTAPAAAAVAQYLPQPTMPQYQPPTVVTQYMPEARGAQSAGAQPPWLIPAAIAGAVALFALTQRGKS